MPGPLCINILIFYVRPPVNLHVFSDFLYVMVMVKKCEFFRDNFASQHSWNRHVKLMSKFKAYILSQNLFEMTVKHWEHMTASRLLEARSPPGVCFLSPLLWTITSDHPEWLCLHLSDLIMHKLWDLKKISFKYQPHTPRTTNAIPRILHQACLDLLLPQYMD